MNEKLDIDVKTLRPFTKFIYTIGELPTSYLISMTYEEQLIWLCNYLTNTVIPTINNNAEAVKEVQDLVTQLQNYINNYFDNLDVQEEINNKLDKMVADGTLQEIITSYLNANALWCFDTITDMKSATNLIVGSYAKTLGYHELNDGGGALYKIIAKNSTLANGNININESIDAELICFKSNPLNFGAYGDGIHNDTQTLQNCFDYANEKSVDIYIPNKTFLTDTITINEVKNIKIEGTIELTSNTQNLNILESTDMYACNIDINTVNVGTILMKGLNTADVKIQRCRTLTLLADATTKHGWIAYCKFYLGFINILNIQDDGTPTKYINENLFIGGRFAQINIGNGVSAYKHENNLFLKPMCEDTQILLNYARGNIFQDARLEGPTTSITFTENSMANVIYQDWSQSNVGYWFGKEYINDNITVTDNSYGRNAIKSHRGINENIITNINVTNNPRNMMIDGDMLYPLQGKIIWKSDLIPMPLVETALICSSVETRYMFRIFCYDENKTLIETDPELQGDIKWSGISWNSAQHRYNNNSYSYRNYVMMLKPSNTVKYIHFEIFSIEDGERYHFDNFKITMNSYGNISPNTLDLAKKHIDE